MGEIVSDQHRREQRVLQADPIIIAMAQELRALPPEEQPTPKVLEGWDFMRRAMLGYEQRGGRNARTIGGVAKAIAALLAKEEHDGQA